MSHHFRPPPPVPVTIDGPAGPLEARIEDPARGQSPPAIGVVCHPHPLYGGTMQNKVVHTLARAMQEVGVPTVRFNFRGVGASTGSYDGGVGELEDALAACAWAREHWQCPALWLAGFSFGAAVALQAAGVVHPAALVTVAPPIGRIVIEPVARPNCLWLVVQGALDELVDATVVRRWVAEFDDPPQLVELPDADHFFHGALGELRAGVHRFVESLGAQGESAADRRVR